MTEKRPNGLTPERLTVHYVETGWTLCAMPGHPVDWPATHRYVGGPHTDVVTCDACLDVLHARAAGGKSARPGEAGR